MIVRLYSDVLFLFIEEWIAYTLQVIQLNRKPIFNISFSLNFLSSQGICPYKIVLITKVCIKTALNTKTSLIARKCLDDITHETVCE